MIYTIHDQLPVVLKSRFMVRPQQPLSTNMRNRIAQLLMVVGIRTNDFCYPLRCSYVAAHMYDFVDIRVTVDNVCYVVNSTNTLKYAQQQAADVLIALRKNNRNHSRGIVFTKYKGVQYNCSIPSPSILKHSYSLERLLSLLRLNGISVELEGTLVERQTCNK